MVGAHNRTLFAVLLPLTPIEGAAFVVICTSLVSCTSTGSACAAAGGTCVLSMNCAQSATSDAQDCIGSQMHPGGPFCCLIFKDGGRAMNDGGNFIIIRDGSADGDDGVYASDATKGGDVKEGADASDAPRSLDASADADAE